MSKPTKKSMGMHICVGADGMAECHFNGACYGMICVAPRLCSKKSTELTDKERAYIKRCNTEWAK